ncbi:MAG TPA: hypothetical protein VJ044_08510, partial [Candidatus Hodarchaeales archaeon]|nr:hypothetical protein [Candidatus Hodarchaeales archaeon]
TKLFFNGTFMTINTTIASNFTSADGSAIQDYYALISNPTDQKILASSFEFASKGRMVVLGSTEILSNHVLNSTTVNVPIQGIQNDRFAVNLIRWLGRGSG